MKGVKNGQNPDGGPHTYNEMTNISEALHSEVQFMRPLSDQLRGRLERFPRNLRAVIVSYKKDGCTPLFTAAKKGNVEVVEYLITFCDAPVEQICIYEVPDDRTVHYVTPLWCAAISNKLPVVKCLIRHGANKNACSDTGSTPVRSACYMTNIEVVKFLVENGADIRKTNQNGGSCLINAVQSVELCQYLISKGINVNAKDIQDKTALHYAVQENLHETVELLLDHGADPFAKSRHGDDALQTACIKGAYSIFDLLKSRIPYTAERLAEAHELIGATFLDDRNQTRVAAMHWQMATHLRVQISNPIVKLPAVPQRAAYLNESEFTTLEELEAISFDPDSMRVQSLLMYERILGLHHRDTLYRLIYRGTKYIDSLQYQRSIDLWTLALEVRIEKYSVLYSETMHTTKAIVRLMLDLYEQELANPEPELPRFEDVMAVLHLLTNDIENVKNLLQIQPIFKKQHENFDRILMCITHLIFLGIMLSKDNAELNAVIRKLIVLDIRSATSRDTILHLCVSRLNVIKSSFLHDEANILPIFPHLKVVQHLLACGASVNAVNESRSTPLLIASLLYNFDPQVIKLLLDYGAHMDQPNKKQQLPLKLIQANPTNELNIINYLSLKCLAATVVAKYLIPYKNIIPKTLEIFVRSHEA